MERRGRAFFKVMVKKSPGKSALYRPWGQVQFGKGKRILFYQIRSIRHNNSFRQLEDYIKWIIHKAVQTKY